MGDILVAVFAVAYSISFPQILISVTVFLELSCILAAARLQEVKPQIFSRKTVRIK